MGNKDNAWHGPAEVVYQKVNTIFAYYNGEMRKVAMCRAKPYELIERTEEEKNKNDEQEETPEIIEEESEAENDDKIEDSETEREDESEIRRDIQNDIIGAKYLQVEKSVYFMDYEIFLEEVPLKDHKKPEIVEAKNKEI